MTAANADEWVPVKPGGEGVLAMSMAYVIIRDGLGDSAAADALTGGGGHEALSAFSPDSQQVRDTTGVEAWPHRGAGPRFRRPAQPAGNGHRRRLRGRPHQRPVQPACNLLAQRARGQRQHPGRRPVQPGATAAGACNNRRDGYGRTRILPRVEGDGPPAGAHDPGSQPRPRTACGRQLPRSRGRRRPRGGLLKLHGRDHGNGRPRST